MALAGPFGGQEGIAGDDQALTGVVRVGELAEVHLVEERELQRAVILGERLDLGGPQRRQPAEAPHLLQGLDARRGDHPPVADHDEMGEPEPVAHHLGDVFERGRIGGVAGEDPDGDRRAVSSGQKPVPDLGLVALGVARVPEGGQRARPPLEPRRGQVEVGAPRRVHLGCKMSSGQGCLDGVLTAHQPVHRRVHLVGAHVLEPQVLDEGRVVPPGDRRQFRLRVHDSSEHQRVGDVAFFAGRAEEVFQSQDLGLAGHGGEVVVGARAHQLEVLTGDEERLARQPGPQRLDELGRQVREVGERLVAHGLSDPDRTAQEVGLVVALDPIGPGVVATRGRDVHRTAVPLGHKYSLHRCDSKVNALVATSPSSELTVSPGWSTLQGAAKP